MSSRRKRFSPAAEAEHFCSLGKDKSGFQKQYINDVIGYGLFTSMTFEKGSFLLEYRGERSLVSDDEEMTSEDSYVFHFKHCGVKYRIDASSEGSCLARYINDEETKPNCRMKKLVFNNVPHLCLFALTDINQGAELRYNYGEDDYPWRKVDVTTKPVTTKPTSLGETSPLNLAIRHGELSNAATPDLQHKGERQSRSVHHEDSDPCKPSKALRRVEFQHATSTFADTEAYSAGKTSPHLEECQPLKSSLSADVEPAASASLGETSPLDQAVRHGELSNAATPDLQHEGERQSRSVHHEDSDPCKPSKALRRVEFPHATSTFADPEAYSAVKSSPHLEECQPLKSSLSADVEPAATASLGETSPLDQAVRHGELSNAATPHLQHEGERQSRSVHHEDSDPCKPSKALRQVEFPHATSTFADTEAYSAGKTSPHLEECQPLKSSLSADVEPAATASLGETSPLDQAVRHGELSNAATPDLQHEGERQSRSVHHEDSDPCKPSKALRQVEFPHATSTFADTEAYSAGKTSPHLEECQPLKSSLSADVEPAATASLGETSPLDQAVRHGELSNAATPDLQHEGERQSRSVHHEDSDPCKPSKALRRVEILHATSTFADTEAYSAGNTSSHLEECQPPKSSLFAGVEPPVTASLSMQTLPIASNCYSANQIVTSSNATAVIIDSDSEESEPDDPDYVHDPDYVPDSASDGDVSCSDDILQIPETRRRKKNSPVVDSDDGSVEFDCEPRESNGANNQQAESSDCQNPKVSSSSCEQSDIEVLCTSNEEERRRWDKPQFCPFCLVGQKKLPRHLTTEHKYEPQVNEWLGTKEPKKRAKLLTLMRNYGNFLHNHKVLEEGKGTLIVVYRPKYKANARDYLPCTRCYGYFAKSDLWKHKCSQATDESDATDEPVKKKRRTGLAKASRMMLPITPGVSKRTHEILATMKDDNIARVVRSDRLIQLFGEKLTLKHGHTRDQEGYIRQRLRELARMLFEYRILTEQPNAQMEDLICPKKFHDVVKATRQASGFNGDDNIYTTPSLALKIGHSLKTCTEILRGEALVSGDEAVEKKSRAVAELYSLHWEGEVSHHALRTLEEAKRNNPKILPLTEDVVKLSRYLQNQAKTNHEELLRSSGSEMQKAWVKLAEVLLSQVIVFNRKRSGEVSRMTLNDYNKCARGETCIVDGALSVVEKALCKALWRVEIIGKRSRTVPILLTTKMKADLDTLTECRKEAGLDHNKYLFGMPGGSGHLRGTDTLRNHSARCEAKNPELLRATRLRKHIATVSQVMNLQDNELDILAGFLGHDVRTHREYYRLPDSTLQVAKLSKVLLKMESGDISGLAGKSLKDVHVGSDEECLCSSDDGSEASDSESELCTPVVEDKGDTDVAETVGTSKRQTKKMWSDAEKEAVNRHLGIFLRTRKLCGKDLFISAMKADPRIFKGRTWTNIKDFFVVLGVGLPSSQIQC
eukprot:XP_011673408.1 PREDICTED: uncharacterized protein LOC100892236 [Strongylocentrotus purpuratus]